MHRSCETGDGCHEKGDLGCALSRKCRIHESPFLLSPKLHGENNAFKLWSDIHSMRINVIQLNCAKATLATSVSPLIAFQSNLPAQHSK